RRAVRLDQPKVVEVPSRAIGGHDGPAIAKDGRPEPRAVMTEPLFRRSTVRGELMKIEEPLIPQIRECEHAAAVCGPVDDVMDPIGPRDAPRIRAVRVHHPERPALVAALVRAVRDLRAVRREAVCANTVGLVAKTPRDPP